MATEEERMDKGRLDLGARLTIDVEGHKQQLVPLAHWQLSRAPPLFTTNSISVARAVYALGGLGRDRPWWSL
jgi:hypothetical protein